MGDVEETLEAVDVALDAVEGGFIAAEARRMEPQAKQIWKVI